MKFINTKLEVFLRVIVFILALLLMYAAGYYKSYIDFSEENELKINNLEEKVENCEVHNIDNISI